jgi:phage gp36-like protein
VSQYATVVELADIVPAAALAGLSEGQQNRALQVASSEIDSIISTRHTDPLVTWPDAIKLHVSKMAFYHLMNGRGRKPGGGADDLITKGYDDGLSWARMVAKGQANLGSQGDAPIAAPSVYSDTDRGYADRRGV